MQPEYARRLKAFRHVMEQELIAGYLVSSPENLHYLAGFYGEAAWLLLTQEARILITDSRYLFQAQEQCPGWTIRENRAGMAETLVEQVNELALTTLGLDDEDMTVGEYRRLEKMMGPCINLIPSRDPCRKLRQLKDAWETCQIRQACAIADQALEDLMPLLRPGISERRLACELEYRLSSLGSEMPSFATIAAAGPQGAMPHARPGSYILQAGDMVTLDFGAVVNGYHSDMTRTFVLGQPNALQKERYNLVLSVQEAALAALCPGRTMREIDAIARSRLTEAGYGEYFGHGLGHSVGLEIHEDPRFSPKAANVPLATGMVMTVEPGIYLPGWGGVRIEDTVAITEEGIDILTKFPKGLEKITIFW